MQLKALMLQFAAQYQLFKEDAKILVAVSGGVDSMVMLRLLHDAGVNMVVAHCNFKLRGKESDDDETFVKIEAQKLGIECRVKNFDTAEFAKKNGISIQMAARKMRYEWFNELSENEGYEAIAIAHNKDDSIETLFINIARGTGIQGLTSIKPANGKIIRPLLFAWRADIEDYAEKQKINFREDSSNATDKYARNYIRHNVIPGLEQFFPGVRQTIERNIENFSSVEKFYTQAIEQYKKEVVVTADELIYIDLPKLSQSPHPPTLLYEILKRYGFSNSTVADILEKNCSGRQFFSATHRVVHDRQSLILQKVVDCQLHSETSSFDVVDYEIFDNYSGFVPDTDPNIACLDFDKLQFPLLMRTWEHGDKFRPLGMKGMKKLSDFFVDLKLSIPQKENCKILVSGGKIAWIVGLRIDDRFKITNKTTKIFRLK